MVLHLLDLPEEGLNRREARLELGALAKAMRMPFQGVPLDGKELNQIAADSLYVVRDELG
jgi:hypothetical protein